MTPATGEPTVVVAAAGDVAGLAADHILRVLGAAIASRGVAHWATTGGSNPADIYHALRGTGPARRASTGTPSRSGGATTGSSRATIRSRT